MADIFELDPLGKVIRGTAPVSHGTSTPMSEVEAEAKAAWVRMEAKGVPIEGRTVVVRVFPDAGHKAKLRKIAKIYARAGFGANVSIKLVDDVNFGAFQRTK